MESTPLPLLIALLISYTAMLLMVTTTLRIARLGIDLTRVLLWTVIGMGGASLALRTAYFLL